MYEFENNFLTNQQIEFYPAASEEEMALFERKYTVKLPLEITEFYRCLNGYYYEGDMVDLYPFHRIVTLQESHINRPLMPAIDHFFVLGDYNFGGSFWLLKVLAGSYRIYVLHMGTNTLNEIPYSFKDFIYKLVEEPCNVFGVY